VDAPAGATNLSIGSNEIEEATVMQPGQGRSWAQIVAERGLSKGTAQGAIAGVPELSSKELSVAVQNFHTARTEFDSFRGRKKSKGFR
jgi:hypothetical protein